jgi:DNA-binding CsgD family transcriptional regulator
MIEQKYIDAFWAKVDQSGSCWLWRAARDQDGYGRYSIYKGPQWRAHRFALESLGHNIPLGYVVMHICDTPACCNPAHLKIGTVQENNLDKLAKGRQRGALGSCNGRARLTESQVRKIRQDSRHYSDIAQELGVHPETVRMAKTNATWQHIKETHDAP